MKVSVIIPTYKPKEYFKTCLNSRFRQTLSPQLFEIIIILNGCNEPYHSTISNYVNNNVGEMPVRILQTDTGGVSNARNMGINAAKGQYICFIDDDDWVSESYLSLLLDSINSPHTVSVSDVRIYNEDNDSYSKDYLSKAYEKKSVKDNVNILQGHQFMSVACCKMIPLTVIGTHRFDTKFKRGEDSLFMASISHNIHQLSLSPSEAVYYRRIRQSSASRRIMPKEIVKDSFRKSLAFAKIYISNPIQYDFIFFANRIMASAKGILNIF